MQSTIKDNLDHRKCVTIIGYSSILIESLLWFYNLRNTLQLSVIYIFTWWEKYLIGEICGAVAWGSAAAVWFTIFFLHFSNELQPPSYLQSPPPPHTQYNTLLVLLHITHNTLQVACSGGALQFLRRLSREAAALSAFLSRLGGGEEYQLAMRGLEKQN